MKYAQLATNGDRDERGFVQKSFGVKTETPSDIYYLEHTD